MTGAGGGAEPGGTSGWSPDAPRHRLRLPRRAGAVGHTLGVVAACYLTALLVLNLSTTSYGALIDRIFPRLGAGTTLNQSSISAEWQVIQRNYVFRDVPSNAGTQGAEQGIVQFLHDTYQDRFSAYLTPTEYGQLTSTLSGRRDGSIGIALEGRCPGAAVCASGQTATEPVIESVLSGQPADSAGIKRGDVLVAVDGRALSSLSPDVATQIDKSAALVRGSVGTRVALTVLRGGQNVTVTVTRQNLQIASVYSTVIGHTLFMQVTGFDSDTGDAAKAQLQKGLAGGVTSIILDLRGNGGGYVSAAQSLVSQFVAPTPQNRYVVVRRGRLAAGGDPKSAQEIVSDPLLDGGTALTQPLVVLADSGSASASEITAAALHDYHRAKVVGEKTFGKGSVQVDFPLPDGADLHLTVERWYGPGGESIEGTGITPDRIVSLDQPDLRFRLDAQSAPPASDPQLAAAMSLLGG